MRAPVLPVPGPGLSRARTITHDDLVGAFQQAAERWPDLPDLYDLGESLLRALSSSRSPADGPDEQSPADTS